MSEQNHTPGPWTVQRLNHAGGETWLQIGWLEGEREIGPIAELVGGAVKPSAPAWHPVAELKYLVAADGEQLANARLIAAAPELLATLTVLECPVCDMSLGYSGKRRTGHCSYCAPARAVIAKATGEQQ